MESFLIGAMTWEWLFAQIQSFSLVALMLGFVIFIHELGHFLVAKACGVKCEKFYVGFDFFDIPLGFFKIPRSLVKLQWGETEYGIGSIPLGGYVKMLGQDDNPQNAEAETERITVNKDATGKAALDPRSFPAKSVPARMAIISAGVVMNILSGILLCAVAYQMGVKYQPAEIGRTIAGDPAWQIGLLPGERILQIGKDGTPNEHMRFQQDMSVRVALSDFGKKMDLLVRRRDGKEEWVQMEPSTRWKGSANSRPSLGVTNASSTIIGKASEEQKTHFGAAWKNLEPGDVLVRVNDQTVTGAEQVQAYVAEHPRDVLKMEFKRTAKQPDGQETTSNIAIELAPLPLADFGVVMEMTPIFAVQLGSSAEKAGIEKGDRLLSFDGEPIGDPLAFPQRTLAVVGKTVAVEVERTDDKNRKETRKFDVEVRTPLQGSLSSSMADAISVETLGIAYHVPPKVTEVIAGGPADGKLKPGDVVKSVKFLGADDAENAKLKELFGKHFFDVIEMDGRRYGWHAALETASGATPTTKMQVNFERGGKQESVELTARPSAEIFDEDRRLPFEAKTEVHKTSSWGEAFSLGTREMKERMSEVFAVLVRLVTGKISVSQLGGPISVIGGAAAHASIGIPELLMFFVYISANLAIINFLPIPALDGGHMLFLTYEAIFRKPVNEDLQIKLSLLGILSLLSLMVFVTAMDIQRWFL